MKIVKSDLADEGVICVAAIGNCGLYACQFAYSTCLKNGIAVGGLTKCGHELPLFNTPEKNRHVRSSWPWRSCF